MSKPPHASCDPSASGVVPIGPEAIVQHLAGIPEWHLRDDAKAIERTFLFKNFVQSVAFIDAVATIAESENHHPDLFLHAYRKVTVTLWTHAVGGLSETDFIVAARIDEVL